MSAPASLLPLIPKHWVGVLHLQALRAWPGGFHSVYVRKTKTGGGELEIEVVCTLFRWCHVTTLSLRKRCIGLRQFYSTALWLRQKPFHCFQSHSPRSICLWIAHGLPSIFSAISQRFMSYYTDKTCIDTLLCSLQGLSLSTYTCSGGEKGYTNAMPC